MTYAWQGAHSVAYVTRFAKGTFSHTKFDPFFEISKIITFELLSKTFHVQSYINGLPFEMKRSLISARS